MFRSSLRLFHKVSASAVNPFTNKETTCSAFARLRDFFHDELTAIYSKANKENKGIISFLSQIKNSATPSDMMRQLNSSSGIKHLKMFKESGCSVCSRLPDKITYPHLEEVVQKVEASKSVSSARRSSP